MIIEYEDKAKEYKLNLIENWYQYNIVINRLEKAILKSPTIVDTNKTFIENEKIHNIFCRHYSSSLPKYTIALYFINMENKIKIIKIDYLA